MSELSHAFEKAGFTDKNKVIRKGFVFYLSEDQAEKMIKNHQGTTPKFLTKKYRTNYKKKYKKVISKPPWIVLKDYQKRGNSGKIKIAIRSSLKEEQKNREPSDYIQNFSHIDIDIDHNYCKIDLEGLYKGNLPQKQNLGKPYLKELSDESEEFSCYDPETEKIIMHFNKLDEVYD